MTDIIKTLAHIFIKKGDITKEPVDAIINAANPALLGGGGVDGAIHRAAGPGLLDECRKLGGCKHGEARLTRGYNLPAKHVIHTPGPVYRDGLNGERSVLTNSYINSLLIAKEHGFKSIAFPSISTGVYGYPKHEACEIAVNTVIDFCISNEYHPDIYFIQFDDENYNIYTSYINKLKNNI